MVREEPEESPKDPKNPVENGQNVDGIFSPRFKSVAAMAGWDEEAILLASLVVEDTPDRESKCKRRSDLQLKTPPTNSRRKRRTQRRSPISIPVVLDLEEAETIRKESEKEKSEMKTPVTDEKKIEAIESSEQNSGVSCSTSALPCMDRLKEELSCAICLEICFEPSTTPCGHSFCKKCLRSAADKCGRKCPKCRQLLSNGRSCSVNTVLWNTIQLLFPQEVEARKAAGALNGREAARYQVPEAAFYNNLRNRSAGDTSVRRRVNDRSAPFLARLPETWNPSAGDTREIAEIPETAIYNNNMWNRSSRNPRGSVISTTDHTSLSRRRENILRQHEVDAAAIAQRPQRTSAGGDTRVRARRRVSGQNGDAAIALRLQREEFMEAFRGTNEQSRLQREEFMEAFRGTNEQSRLQREEEFMEAFRGTNEQSRLQREEEFMEAFSGTNEQSRLLREEFMEAFRGRNNEQSSSSLSLARVNLRAMASRAVNLRIRDQHMQ